MLEVMKQFMVQQGMKEDNLVNGKQHQLKKRNLSGDKGIQVDHTNSDTTIYHNVLQRIENNDEEVQVDPEITFRKNKRDSSSLEDKVDTSDEMIDMDLEINQRFIADCVNEASNQRKRPFLEEDRQIDSAKRQADKIIHEA